MLKNAGNMCQDASDLVATSEPSATPRRYVQEKTKVKQTEKVRGIAGQMQCERSRSRGPKKMYAAVALEMKGIGWNNQYLSPGSISVFCSMSFRRGEA